jgi:hypothetical protein
MDLFWLFLNFSIWVASSFSKVSQKDSVQIKIEVHLV